MAPFFLGSQWPGLVVLGGSGVYLEPHPGGLMSAGSRVDGGVNQWVQMPRRSGWERKG